VFDKAILPCHAALVINAFNVPGAENYMGGAAIVSTFISSHEAGRN